MNLPFAVREKIVNKVIEVDIGKIDPNPYQPRRSFGSDLAELAESIRQNGILQPLTVRAAGERYTLVAGERRLRASKMIGLATVPCIVTDMSEQSAAVMALVENIQRRDLHFFDEAQALFNLIDLYGLTQEDAAAKLGKTQSTIANKLRLLRLSSAVRIKICEYGLTERHARALLRLETEESQLKALESIHKRKLNVEGAENLIDAMLSKQEELESIRRRSGAFKDVRLFVNTINKAVEMMKAAGINADSRKVRQDGYIEYIVRIPTE